MARSRSIAITALVVALATAQLQAVRSQSPDSHLRPAPPKDVTCVVYPLAGIGHDPGLPQWVAETIPSVVDPESWRLDGMTISFHAASKVLVVRQSPTVHAKVKAFLADLKNAAHEENGAVHLRKPSVMHAEFTQTAPAKVPAGQGAGYPVPAPLSQPKHLFHLVLRYEGDGLPENAVESVVKQLSEAADKGEGDAKPRSQAAKGPSLGQLLHFIVRYEGDGIIDANVVALLKELNKDGGQRWVSPTAGPTCGAVSMEPPPPTGVGPVTVPVAPTGNYVGATTSPVPAPTSTPGSGWARMAGSATSPVPAPTLTQPGSNPAQGPSSQPPASYKPYAQPH
jgi:hypothetical protein